MVKNNTFNGMPLPDIALRHAGRSCEVGRRFGYQAFKTRPSWKDTKGFAYVQNAR